MQRKEILRTAAGILMGLEFAGMSLLSPAHVKGYLQADLPQKPPITSLFNGEPAIQQTVQIANLQELEEILALLNESIRGKNATIDQALSAAHDVEYVIDPLAEFGHANLADYTRDQALGISEMLLGLSRDFAVGTETAAEVKPAFWDPSSKTPVELHPDLQAILDKGGNRAVQIEGSVFDFSQLDANYWARPLTYGVDDKILLPKSQIRDRLIAKYNAEVIRLEKQAVVSTFFSPDAEVIQVSLKGKHPQIVVLNYSENDSEKALTDFFHKPMALNFHSTALFDNSLRTYDAQKNIVTVLNFLPEHLDGFDHVTTATNLGTIQFVFMSDKVLNKYYPSGSSPFNTTPFFENCFNGKKNYAFGLITSTKEAEVTLLGKCAK